MCGQLEVGPFYLSYLQVAEQLSESDCRYLAEDTSSSRDANLFKMCFEIRFINSSTDDQIVPGSRVASSCFTMVRSVEVPARRCPLSINLDVTLQASRRSFYRA